MIAAIWLLCKIISFKSSKGYCSYASDLSVLQLGRYRAMGSTEHVSVGFITFNMHFYFFSKCVLHLLAMNKDRWQWLRGKIL